MGIGMEKSARDASLHKPVTAPGRALRESSLFKII
jgi:hypothetical protein